MGSCLAVEVVRDEPSHGSAHQARPVFVREKGRRSDESSIYRPRSSSVRRHDHQPRERSDPFENPRYEDNTRNRKSENRNTKPFEPLPPPVPLAPFNHNHHNRNNSGGLDILDIGGHGSNHDGIQIIDDFAEPLPGAHRNHRRNRRTEVHTSRRDGRNRRYYDDSDDDSRAGRRPRSGYSDDYEVEVYRPGRIRSNRRRSRSRNSRYYN